jgi:hypothetical protein
MGLGGVLVLLSIGLYNDAASSDHKVRDARRKGFLTKHKI